MVFLQHDTDLLGSSDYFLLEPIVHTAIQSRAHTAPDCSYAD
jgi:hypothetical protein